MTPVTRTGCQPIRTRTFARPWTRAAARSSPLTEACSANCCSDRTPRRGPPMEETPEDIYIDREADYEAMRTAFELGGHTVHHVPDGEYPSGAAFISCSDDSMTMTVGDWVT